MASLSALQALAPSPFLLSSPSPNKRSSSSSSCVVSCRVSPPNFDPPKEESLSLPHVAAAASSSCSRRGKRGPPVVCAVGDVSAEGTNYLIVGAVLVAILGTAFPILFSRKDLCPECDGAGFVRKPGAALTANAARKDVDQIVCPRCNGLGKLGQVDK